MAGPRDRSAKPLVNTGPSLEPHAAIATTYPLSIGQHGRISMMISRRLGTAARPLSRAFQPATRTTITRMQARYASQAEIEDPGMNGGYVNPPRVKRQFRDPYGDWWDKQERRNFGEPVHEDNDILGIFSTEQYTHFSSGFGAVLLGTFVLSVFGLCAVVAQAYPDKSSIPRHFEGGLEKELGGPTALPAYKTEQEAIDSLEK